MSRSADEQVLILTSTVWFVLEQQCIAWKLGLVFCECPRSRTIAGQLLGGFFLREKKEETSREKRRVVQGNRGRYFLTLY